MPLSCGGKEFFHEQASIENVSAFLLHVRSSTEKHWREERQEGSAKKHGHLAKASLQVTCTFLLGAQQ